MSWQLLIILYGVIRSTWQQVYGIFAGLPQLDLPKRMVRCVAGNRCVRALDLSPGFGDFGRLSIKIKRLGCG